MSRKRTHNKAAKYTARCARFTLSPPATFLHSRGKLSKRVSAGPVSGSGKCPKMRSAQGVQQDVQTLEHLARPNWSTIAGASVHISSSISRRGLQASGYGLPEIASVLPWGHQIGKHINEGATTELGESAEHAIPPGIVEMHEIRRTESRSSIDRRMTFRGSWIVFEQGWPGFGVGTQRWALVR